MPDGSYEEQMTDNSWRSHPMLYKEKKQSVQGEVGDVSVRQAPAKRHEQGSGTLHVSFC